MVKVESIFKFLETVFNTLTEQVVCDDSFGSGVELVGNKDVVTVIIILISFAKDDYKLNGDIAIFKFCLKRIGFMWNFRAIRSFEFDVFDFTAVMFFDEGNDLIWFDTTVDFLYRIVHEDVSVWFYFWVEDFAFFMDVFKEAGCSIPWVENRARETADFWVGVEKFYGYLYFVFKLRIVFSSGEFRGREIRHYVDREVLCWWDEDGANADIADLLSFEWSTILPLCPLGLFLQRV